MTAGPPWRAPRPLLLASGSPTRRGLLEAAGIPVEVEAPRVDERALQERAEAAGRPRDEVARLLAREKALEVAARRPDRLVLAADQTLEAQSPSGDRHPGRKASDMDEARRFLAALSGRSHHLHAAFALAQGSAVRCEAVESARLTMRPLSGKAIEGYLAAVGEDALASVGGYRIEGMGMHLFSRIEGEHSAILGLPMTSLLAALRRMGALAW